MPRYATTQEKRDYIKQYGDIIIESTKGTNLLPSVVMAQAIVEGNAGISTLAKKYNNHFGVKAFASWKGMRIKMKTGENTKDGKKFDIMADFRVYPSAYDSIIDHNKLMFGKIYAKVHQATTPQGQLQALKDAGYATDVNYVKTNMSVINAFNLTHLDEKKKV